MGRFGKNHGATLTASMGPRSIDRGNFNQAVNALLMLMLQWCRDRSIAEMHSSTDFQFTSVWLQWGRDRSIAEICHPFESARRISSLQWGRDRSIAEITR